MYPKYIIVTNPGEHEGFLRLGYAWNHRDLRIGYEIIHGGGWYDRDDYNMKIVLYGFSVDFGEADFTFLDRIPKELQEYKFYRSSDPYYQRGDFAEEIDLSHIEWV